MRCKFKIFKLIGKEQIKAVQNNLMDTCDKNQLISVQIMNSNRQVKGNVGHAVQLDKIMTLNLSNDKHQHYTGLDSTTSC